MTYNVLTRHKHTINMLSYPSSHFRPTSVLVTNSVSMFLLRVCAFLPIKVTAAYMIFEWIQ